VRVSRFAACLLECLRAGGDNGVHPSGHSTRALMKHSKKSRSKVRKAAAPADSVMTVLPANCTIRDIAVLHDCLRSAPPDSRLDGSAVQRIDTAGLQLLVAFLHERRTANLPVEWQSVSAELSDAASLVGAMSVLHLPGVS